MVEYRMNPPTGRFALMEVNGRFWGSLPLALHAGADFPMALVRCQSFGGCPELAPYRYPVRCRLLAGDTKWLIRVLWSRSGSPLGAIAVYLADFRPSVKYYKWSWDDPGPAFRAIFQRILRRTKRILTAAVTFLGCLRRRRAEIGASRLNAPGQLAGVASEGRETSNKG